MISLMGWRHGDPSRPVTIETMLMVRTPPSLGLKIRGPLGTTERVSSVGHAVVVNGGDGKSCTGDSWPKDASIMLHGWSVAVAPMVRQSG